MVKPLTEIKVTKLHVTNPSLSDIIKNKSILMEYMGWDIDYINKLPYYEFENYVIEIKEKK